MQQSFTPLFSPNREVPSSLSQTPQSEFQRMKSFTPKVESCSASSHALLLDNTSEHTATHKSTTVSDDEMTMHQAPANVIFEDINKSPPRETSLDPILSNEPNLSNDLSPEEQSMPFN